MSDLQFLSGSRLSFGNRNGRDDGRGWVSRLAALVAGGKPSNGEGNGSDSEDVPDGSVSGALERAIDRELEERRDFSEEELLMIHRVLQFGRHRVEDAMVPRADIVAVEAETPLDELIRIFQTAAHSRLPVYRETLDDPIGVVHLKDVVAHLAQAAKVVPRKVENAANGSEETENVAFLDFPFSLQNLKRDILFVPSSMPAVALLLKMQTTRIHMALVIDEYGGTDGLVTMEDLVELIVGDIEDEHDTEESPLLLPSGEDTLIAHARVEIGDLEQALGIELVLEEQEDVDTLGGLIFTLVGRVPQRGELINHPAGIEFEVLEADPRRLKRLRVRKTPARSDAPLTGEEKADAAPSDTQ